ncbi:MAG: hypothetical protein NZM07_00580, partial [Elioraea sp.]|nr:hypothetical protein [Elioraea sp.]
NVRQLVSVLRTAAALAAGEAELRREHLPEDLLDELDRAAAPAAATASAGAAGDARAPALAPLGALKQNAIERALSEHAGNVSAAARALGISRNTVYRYLAVNAGESARVTPSRTVAKRDSATAARPRG